MPLDQYLSYGTDALEQTRAQFVATARRSIRQRRPCKSIYRSRKCTPHPACCSRRPRAISSSLRAFIEAKHIVTLPANANIKVIETPAFERTTTTAVGGFARSAGDRRDASVLLRNAGRPDVEPEAKAGVFGAVQRLRVSDHLGARSLSRALHELLDRSRLDPEPHAQALGKLRVRRRLGALLASR